MNVAPDGGAYYLILFILGTLIGSYLNVVSLRFSREEGFRASRKGRSHCPHCDKTLKWYELIPLLSFLIQRGKCRSCPWRISLQYPIVELLAGLSLVLTPWQLGWSPLTILWILAFLLFILIAAIDLRLGIIPDKLNILVAVLGLLVALLVYFGSGLDTSFLGSYALLFQLGEGSFWVHRLAGAMFGLVFFGGIYLFTRGKAMGLGDVKLAGAIGFLLGWPDIALALVLAFFVGSIFAIPLLLMKRKTLKDALPFGPFIVAGVTLVFFFGYHIINGYFYLFNFY
ncbi:MAG: prepilin peptidase [Candidatus Colwellbacteria bacterium]|nr:prepilin peptidase [Candidatus Colwellbacteria bacterium]